MIGLTIGLGRFMDDTNTGILIEAVIITAVTLAFLYLIDASGHVHVMHYCLY